MTPAERRVLTRIQGLVRRRAYRLSLHAERERDADTITIADLEAALTSTTAVMIEDYPRDPRGPSHLILGFARRKPIHVVCAIHARTLVIITVYRPDPGLWQNWRVRREKTR